MYWINFYSFINKLYYYDMFMYSIIGQGQLPLHNNDLLNIVQLDACFLSDTR